MSLQTVSGPWHAGVRYFCTTRQLDSSPGEETDAFNLGLNTPEPVDQVRQNRQSLQAQVPARLVWLSQVHGVDILDADAPALPDEAGRLMDAAITTRQDRALAILTADCLPVVLWNEQATILGAAHAGWRGLSSGILERTWCAMKNKQSTSGLWHAWIGPAISQPNFEVGHEVYEEFVRCNKSEAHFFTPSVTPGKWYADLSAIAEYKLKRISSNTIHVYQSHSCTYADSLRFYSYRRSALTGRQATIAYLTKS